MELFALPNELILQIFKHIGDPRTLVAVTCTCRKFKHIAEIFLFSRLVLTRRSSLNQILTLCNDDDRRATYVHDLQLMFSTRHYDFIDSQAVDLRQFSCLRSFASESPFCNPHSRIGGKDDTTWKADLRAFLYAFEEASLLKCPLGAARPLSQLRCLSLDWSASLRSRFWETTPECPIFLLPALRTLRVSCVKIKVPLNSPDLSHLKGMTKLESLVFTESVVSPDAMEQILSFPANLKIFTLHEVNYHTLNTSSYKFFKDDQETSLRALSQQANSLREFNFLGARLDKDLDLSFMDSLTSLRLGWNNYRLGIPPPALELITFEQVDPRMLRTSAGTPVLKYMKLEECIRNCSKRGAKLQLDLCLRRFPGPQIPDIVPNGSPNYRPLPIRQVIELFLRSINKYRYCLTEHPLENEQTAQECDTISEEPVVYCSLVPFRLRVFTVKRTRYIPPFLHGEKTPKWVSRYDTGFIDGPQHNDVQTIQEDELSEDEAMEEAFSLV